MWYSNQKIGEFVVYESNDAVDYKMVSSVTDEERYSYLITDGFTSKYFKVAVQTDDGKIVESVPFVVNKVEDMYIADFIDTDREGLPDVLELIYGTDIELSDTDGDGLTDYEEIVITKTDATISNSANVNMRDGDADSDGDGISNKEEIDKSTNPVEKDSDNDGLSDGEEVLQLGTDPLKEDTDQDGLSDGDEKKLGTEPDRCDSDGDGIDDSKEIYNQKVSKGCQQLASINKEDNAYELEIIITASGNVESAMVVEESSYSNAINNDAQLGLAVDLEYDEKFVTQECSLIYAVKDNYIQNVSGKYAAYTFELSGIKRLQVFRYYEDIHMLLPIETNYDVDNNTVSCNATEMGTYCLMDMELWLESLGYEPEVEAVAMCAEVEEGGVAAAMSPSDIKEWLTKTVLNYVDDIMIKEDYSGHVYGIYSGTTVFSWKQAKDVCEALGGRLVAIDSKGEQDFLTQFMEDSKASKNLYWIGAYRDSSSTSSWCWSDGAEVEYTNWADGEPNNQGNSESYIHMYSNNGKWNDTVNYLEGTTYHATANCGFICEWDKMVETEYKIRLGND